MLILYRYSKGLPDNGEENPEVLFGDGDGTVNLNSGKGCLVWNGKENNFFSKGYELENVEHIDLLTNAKTLQVIDEVLDFTDNFEKSFYEAVFEPDTPTWDSYIENTFSQYVTPDLQSANCYQKIEACMQENNDVGLKQAADLCPEIVESCVKQKKDLLDWILKLAKELNTECPTNSTRKIKSAIFDTEFQKKWPMITKSLPLVNKLNVVLAKKDYCFEDLH